MNDCTISIPPPWCVTAGRAVEDELSCRTPARLLCDGMVDCVAGQDEVECKPGEARCRLGVLVNLGPALVDGWGDVRRQGRARGRQGRGEGGGGPAQRARPQSPRTWKPPCRSWAEEARRGAPWCCRGPPRYHRAARVPSPRYSCGPRRGSWPVRPAPRPRETSMRLLSGRAQGEEVAGTDWCELGKQAKPGQCVAGNPLMAGLEQGQRGGEGEQGVGQRVLRGGAGQGGLRGRAGRGAVLPAVFLTTEICSLTFIL